MGVAIEVLQRKASELGFGVAAQPVNGALCHPGHDVGEQPGEPGGQQIDERGQQEDLPELREVDAAARHHVGPRHQVGDLAVPLRAKAGHRLRLGDPGGQTLADHAIEDDVGRVPDDLGPDHRAGHTAQRKDGGDDDPGALRPKPRQKLAERFAEVFGFLRWEHATETAAEPWPRGRPAARRAPRHHATASSPSCEATISR